MFTFIGASIVGIIIIIGLIIWILSLRRVVETNMTHIVQYRNTAKSYGMNKPSGNAYYQWPSWMPLIGVTVTQMPESNFQVDLRDYEAYDTARLPFVVDITAFFRVDHAETAAQRVSSFSELIEQLKASLQGSVRRILATNTLESIMQERSKFSDEFTAEVEDQIKEWGVKPVKSIEFMDIRDSKGSNVIVNIMAKEQSRIEKESRVQVAENKREAQLKEIDAQREVDVRKQDALQQVGLRTAEKDKTVGIANEQVQQEIKAQAKITKERDMDVIRVEEVKQAEINKDVAIVTAEQEREQRRIQAEAEKTVLVTTAEGDKESTITKAQGSLEAAKLNAQGIEAEGIAKGKAEEAILMAPVTTQITLAKEIGENNGYQTYLVQIEKIGAAERVGIEMSKALQGADVKVITNAGDPQSGIAKVGDLFSAKGGTALTSMLSALNQSEEGSSLLSSLVNRLGGEDKSSPV